MFGAPATQGFSMSQGVPATQGAGEAKKPRQEEKQICLPVTIRSIQCALERKAEAGGDLTFFGVEPGMLVVVACVESVIRQAASLEMTLCDATGRMKARYFVSDAQNSQLDKVVPGCYVSAFGAARAAPVEHIAITGLRLVESADEVSYHMIEAAHAALRLKHGKPQPSTPPKVAAEAPVAKASPQGDFLTPQKQELPSNPYADAAAAAPAPAVKPAAPAMLTGADLRAAVLEVLRESSVGAEGLGQEIIVGKLKAAASDVQSTLAGLVDDGELFHTLNEQTFAAV